MIYTLIGLALVVAGGLIYLSRLPGDYLVQRSLTMQVDRKAVFDKVRDFSSWADSSAIWPCLCPKTSRRTEWPASL